MNCRLLSLQLHRNNYEPYCLIGVISIGLMLDWTNVQRTIVLFNRLKQVCGPAMRRQISQITMLMG